MVQAAKGVGIRVGKTGMITHLVGSVGIAKQGRQGSHAAISVRAFRKQGQLIGAEIDGVMAVVWGVRRCDILAGVLGGLRRCMWAVQIKTGVVSVIVDEVGL